MSRPLVAKMEASIALAKLCCHVWASTSTTTGGFSVEDNWPSVTKQTNDKYKEHEALNSMER